MPRRLSSSLLLTETTFLGVSTLIVLAVIHLFFTDQPTVAKPPPVRHTPAQRAAISKVAAVAAARRPVKAMAPVLASAPAPKTGAPKRTRSLIPVRVNAKPQPKATKLVVKPKSILKPARNGDAAFVQHCSEGPPARKGGFRQPSETIANTTMSRFPTSMWGSMALPIDLPDRFAKPVFHWTRATKVVSLPLVISLAVFAFANLCNPEFSRDPGEGLVD